MMTTSRRRRFDLDVDSGRAMLEWSLGFEVADNGISVGEEMLVVHWRRNHKQAPNIFQLIPNCKFVSVEHTVLANRQRPMISVASF
ncbi:hypothetical protein IGI04_005302 [Brassica rapa subsp. trilocularis]|uniref:Uncharacterized protein n=1 Tax=Brassica rapa subsp. trilocularis TaxID=1813537 RepID=A0ABQ7NDK7_BRACM|nr:hypothetical protein IGI04_005302 [Brassica rapa subsp. trilocularis]